MEPMVTITMSEYNRLKKFENTYVTNNITVGYKYDMKINNNAIAVWMCDGLVTGQVYRFISHGIGSAIDRMEISLHK